MTNGIVQTKKDFSVKDFETGNFVFGIGQINWSHAVVSFIRSHIIHIY